MDNYETNNIGYRNTMIKDYTNTRNKEIRNVIITQMQ